jgi:perosamine synthetase
MSRVPAIHDRLDHQAKDRAISPFYLDIDTGDRRYIHEELDKILDSGVLILGPYTRAFEESFAAYVGAKFAIATSSGTSALEILLRAFDVTNAKVAVPTNTNFASVAAIIRAGGIPVLMDMSGDTFCSDLAILRQTLQTHPDTKAVLWVHIGGIIAPDMFEISEWCRERGVFLLEDCAHAHGSMLHGRSAGIFGDGAAFSFFPTKPMTTMEGGIIVTNQENHSALARSFRNQGKREHDYSSVHIDFGSSWRLSEFSAVIGLRQLQKLDSMRAKRSAVADVYASRFSDADVPLCSVEHMDRASHYKFIVRLPAALSPAAAKAALEQAGVTVGGGVYEVPCHLLPVFRDQDCRQVGDLRVATELCPRHLCPPIHSGMSVSDAERVADLVVSLFETAAN